MMEYVLPNILEAARFDKTAKAIVAAGFSKTSKKFFNRVSILDNGCWTFLSVNNPMKYCVFQAGSEKISLLGHRVSWLLSGLKFKEGLVLDHKCRNRSCLNPFHLQQVTLKENTLLGNGGGALNKRKTHCVRGHSFSGDNVRFVPGRRRVCRECARGNVRKRRVAERVLAGKPPSPTLNKDKTHCVHGHELSGKNVRITPRQRTCRTCARIYMANLRRRKREEHGK